MEHLKIPLSDAEEAVLQLLTLVKRLEAENATLREEVRLLRWASEEHD
jgi:hypothetical protein